MSEATKRHRTARQREIDRRTRAALEKREVGGELTEYEWMIVQYALGGACSSCGASEAMVGARPPGRDRSALPRGLPRAG